MALPAIWGYLGDELVDPRDPERIAQKLYLENSQRHLDTWLFDNLRATIERFRQLVDPGTEGWAQVVPFNDNLVFLADDSGAYDFVFRNLREDPPPKPPWADLISPDDVPHYIWREEAWPYLFDYFRENAWKEKEDHEAEVKYYADGGTAAAHPGSSWRLKERYLLENGLLTSFAPVVSTDGRDGFVEVTLQDGRNLFVQKKPVSIGEFWSFLEDSAYLGRRKTDDENPLDAANLDPPDRPVAVTYFDVLAYIAWFAEATHLPVRLLRTEEYKWLHPGRQQTMGDRLDEGCVEFRMANGNPDVRWGELPGPEWRGVRAHFKPDIPWRRSPLGVDFVVSDSFGEWLYERRGNEAVAINTNDLTGISGRGGTAERDLHPMGSWGKYKYCKIGFRLCWDTGRSTH